MGIWEPRECESVLYVISKVGYFTQASTERLSTRCQNVDGSFGGH